MCETCNHEIHLHHSAEGMVWCPKCEGGYCDLIPLAE